MPECEQQALLRMADLGLRAITRWCCDSLFLIMEHKEIEIFSQESDNGVVRMPECNYLGAVIQGDSLFLLHSQAMDILESLKYNPGNDMFYAAYSLAKDLEDRLEHYIQVCKDNDVELGLRIESSVEDYQELIDSGL